MTDDNVPAAEIDWDDVEFPVRPHTQVHRRCGACQQPFQAYDRMIAITRRDGQLQIYDAQTATSQRFAKQWYKVKARFCKLPGCSTCRVSHESATLHIDCFKLFVNECQAKDKIHRLWLASIVMVPWLQCPEPFLPYNFKDRMTNADAARVWDMPLIERLPPELCHIILGYLRDDDLYSRYIAVLGRVRELSEAASPCQPSVAVPLVDIKHWSRGMAWPFQTPESKGDKLMRITIDASGIQQIERVADVGEPMHSTYLSKLFVVDEIAKLTSVKADIFAGHCRITVPDGVKMVLWDNPMPAKLYAPLRLPEYHEHDRFSAIDTSRCSGITFFFYFGYIVAVHPHTGTAMGRDAQTTFDSLPLTYQDAVLWIYVPLPKNEQVKGFALRNHRISEDNKLIGPCLALFLKQQGTIEIGYRYDLADRYTLYRTTGRPVLMHNVRTGFLRPHPHLVEKEHVAGVSVAAAYPMTVVHKRTPPRPPAEPLTLLQAAMRRIPPKFECHSLAPLEKVRAAEVFTADDGRKNCRGILFYYDNGKIKALGQCRIGVDECTRYLNPTHIVYTATSHTHPTRRQKVTGANVEFTHDINQVPWHLSWRYMVMRGKLEFRFTDKSVVVRVQR